MRTGQPIDIEMFNYEGAYVVFCFSVTCKHLYWSTSFFLSGGLTALHAAVMSHNAVVKELRTLENPCSYMTMELGQRRQMHFECIKILLHMGACFGTKASMKTTVQLIKSYFYFETISRCSSFASAGSKKWTYVSSHGFWGGKRGAVEPFPRPVVFTVVHKCKGELFLL